MSIFTRFINWFLPKKIILFVCSGNTCRSPMAAALANRLLKGTRFRAESAGTTAVNGDVASYNALTAMVGYGINIHNHRSRKVTPKMIRDAWCVYGLTATHTATLKHLCPDVNNIFTLGEISDPFGGDLARYLSCAKQIHNCLVRIINYEITSI